MINLLFGISLGIIIGTVLILVAVAKEDIIIKRIFKEDKDLRKIK